MIESSMASLVVSRISGSCSGAACRFGIEARSASLPEMMRASTAALIVGMATP